MLRLRSTMRTTRRRLKTSEMRSLNISSRASSAFVANEIGPTWRQAIDASALSSARPSAPLMHVARDARDLRIVVGVDDDLVIGADQLEGGVDLADRLGVRDAGQAERGDGEQGGWAMHGKPLERTPTGRRRCASLPATSGVIDAAIVRPFAGA